jgi:hypothetical protein
MKEIRFVTPQYTLVNNEADEAVTVTINYTDEFGVARTKTLGSLPDAPAFTYEYPRASLAFGTSGAGDQRLELEYKPIDTSERVIRGSLDLSIATNSKKGYTLQMEAVDAEKYPTADSSMICSTDAVKKIPSKQRVGGATDVGSAFASGEDAWGYQIGTSLNANGWKAIPNYRLTTYASDSVIQETSGAGNWNGKIWFGVNVNGFETSPCIDGVYKGRVLMTWAPKQ